MRYSLVALAFCSALLNARPSDANTIQINFAGEVDVVSGDAAFQSAFNTSQTVTGSYTFESTTPDTSPLDPTFAQYALISYTISVGSYTAQGVQSNLTVSNSGPPFNTSDYIIVLSDTTGPLVGTMLPYRSSLELYDGSELALNSDALPLTAPDLSAFPFAEWRLTFVDPANTSRSAFVSGPLTSLTTASVPDAGATFWLLSLGITAMAAAGRRFHSEHR